MRKLAFVPAVLALALAPSAGAHNAAHFYLDGVCHEVGSDKEAPLVGPGNPNQTAGGQLDLVSDPKNGVDTSDQYGARYAADRSPQLLPGDC